MTKKDTKKKKRTTTEKKIFKISYWTLFSIKTMKDEFYKLDREEQKKYSQKGNEHTFIAQIEFQSRLYIERSERFENLESRISFSFSMQNLDRSNNTWEFRLTSNATNCFEIFSKWLGKKMIIEQQQIKKSKTVGGSWISQTKKRRSVL